MWLISLACLAHGDGWTVIGHEDGVVISRRNTSGRTLPAFRGKGPIRSRLEDVLALLRDVRSINKWAYGISRAQLVRRLSPDVDLIYLFSHTPWPVRDRDMTVRREIEELRPGSEYRISLRCEDGVEPVRHGIVRVHECESEFRIRRLTDDTTEVDYWASIDPAGHIPSWTSSWMARTVPSRTILAIQQRATHKR